MTPATPKSMADEIFNTAYDNHAPWHVVAKRLRHHAKSLEQRLAELEKVRGTAILLCDHLYENFTTRVKDDLIEWNDPYMGRLVSFLQNYRSGFPTPESPTP